MKTASTADIFYVFLILSALLVSVSASVSKQNGQTTSDTPTSSPTPSPSLCASNPVQCCNKELSSDSEKALSLLQTYGIPIPGTTVNIGYICNSTDDGQVKQGDCGDSVLCCEKVFENIQVQGQNTSIAVDCKDIAV